MDGLVKQYKLESMHYYWFCIISALFLMPAGGVLWVYVWLKQSPREGPLWFIPIWFAAVIYGGYQYMKIPYRIEVSATGLIRFVGLRKTMVPLQDVISISQSAFGTAFLDVKYRGGKVRILNQFTGFHEFLADLTQMNPAVTLRGC